MRILHNNAFNAQYYLFAILQSAILFMGKITIL